MKHPGLSFAYRAHGHRYWPLASVFLGLVVGEGGLLVGVSLLTIGDPVARWCTAAGLFALWVCLPLTLLFAPLFTAHLLSPTDLVLRYGLRRMVVPRRLIRAARPVEEPVEGVQVLAARRDERRDRAVACFSDRGQILLELGEPLPVPLGRFGRSRPVTQILFNVDDRPALLAALGAVR